MRAGEAVHSERACTLLLVVDSTYTPRLAAAVQPAISLRALLVADDETSAGPLAHAALVLWLRVARAGRR